MGFIQHSCRRRSIFYYLVEDNIVHLLPRYIRTNCISCTTKISRKNVVLCMQNADNLLLYHKVPVTLKEFLCKIAHKEVWYIFSNGEIFSLLYFSLISKKKMHQINQICHNFNGNVSRIPTYLIY